MQVGTKFLFYGPKNKYVARTTAYHAGTLDVGMFTGSLPTKIIIHGFGGGCNYTWVPEMRDALLSTVSTR